MSPLSPVLRIGEFTMSHFRLHPAVAAIGALLCAATLSAPAAAQTAGRSYEPVTGVMTPHARTTMRAARNLGGGLIEALATGFDSAPEPQAVAAYHAQPVASAAPDSLLLNGGVWQQRRPSGPRYAALTPAEPARAIQKEIDPQFRRQTVSYKGPHSPGTVIIDTPNRFLYLVQADGVAMRYGIGVGRPGFEWAGAKTITRKAEWPDWRPPAQMLKRRPDLPTFMKGGEDNPLGARAMYLGSSLYRIHGTNEPHTIGEAVSSGCIRMVNDDVVDLYQRVKVGTRVVVM
ncbi:MAG: L,D-transpeptidase [Beijerinckiaceae bacterium]